MYEYRARIARVVDGDTVRADVDLGFSIGWANMDLRLYGINAPEMFGSDASQAGRDARDALIVLLGDAAPGTEPQAYVTIRTVKDRVGKYGRYLATILLADGTDVCQAMIDSGHAVSYYP